MFFLSLIVLSVAMGMHWQKIRPKTRPGGAKPRVALNLQDLQIQDKPVDGSSNQASQPDETPGEESGEGTAADNGDGSSTGDETATADGSEPSPDEPESEGATATADIGSDDPILIALHSMKRNPFERSPYAQLVIEIQKKEEIAALPTEKKSVKLLNANFTATIETRKELVAVIDSRLYRKGELFQDKKISDIKAEIVSLQSGADLFLIPKSGVNVTIAEDGTYTVVDNFHKN